MYLPANELPRLTELVVARLAERGDAGATPAELAELALRSAAVPPGLADALLRPILARDRRVAYGTDGRFRLAPAAHGPPSPAGAPDVVTDVETTGTGADCRIIEIGAVRVRDGELAERFQQLVDPGRAHPLPPEIEELTGITAGMLEGQPPVTEVMPRYAEFLGDAVFVAHNAAFDRRFVYGEAAFLCQIHFLNPVLCTRNLARRLLPQLAHRGLDHVVRELGITITDRHRALGDAEATAKVLLTLFERLEALGYDRLEHALTGQTAEGWRALQKR